MRRAASRYASRAPSTSPAISSRCARTAKARWWPTTRSSSSSGVEQRETGLGSLHHGDRDRAVERGHRIGRRCDRAARRARRSARQSVSSGRSRPRRAPRRSRPGAGTGRAGQCASACGDQRDALGDRAPGPSGCGPARRAGSSAPSARCARAAPGVGQEHQREQTGDLTVVGQQLVHRPGQADRFGGEVGPDQIRPDDVVYPSLKMRYSTCSTTPSRASRSSSGGRRKAAPAVPDRLLRPADALRHRRLGHEERVRDLGGREAADGAERRARAATAATAPDGSRGRATSACRPVAPASARRRRRLVGVDGAERVLAATARLVAAQLVGQPARRDRDQPRRAGCRVRPSLGPLHAQRRGAPPAPRPRRRRSDRSDARARRGPAARARAAGPRSSVRGSRVRPARSCISGRTSTLPIRANGTAPRSRARAPGCRQSMMSKLPRYSLASMYGPSVTAGVPSTSVTVLAITWSPTP